MNSAIEAKPEYARARCVRGRLKGELDGAAAGVADIREGRELGGDDPFWSAL